MAKFNNPLQLIKLVREFTKDRDVVDPTMNYDGEPQKSGFSLKTAKDLVDAIENAADIDVASPKFDTKAFMPWEKELIIRAIEKADGTQEFLLRKNLDLIKS